MARITISGHIGSGKSDVGKQLATELGYTYLSTGAIQRMIAAERGLSTLELNELAGKDPSIDDRIDSYLRDDVNKMNRVVIDSRMAFFFVEHALKIFLVVESSIAAGRLVEANRAEERYRSSEEATSAIALRQQFERHRFTELYGMDIHRLRNYDIVIDTSCCSSREVTELIVLERDVRKRYSANAIACICATRIFPTQHVKYLAGSPASSTPVGRSEAIDIVEIGGWFFVFDGHKRLSRALSQGQRVITCNLLASDSEEVTHGMTARRFSALSANRSWFYDWEDAHRFRFASYPPWVGGSTP